MDSIAQKLSWEIIALNDRGDAKPLQRIALEVAYGVGLQMEGEQATRERFADIMACIALQVTDDEMVRYLRFYTKRGLAQ